jgi:hypothetical protein
MIVSKNAYYVDVPKTGSSYVNNCFELMCNQYDWINRSGQKTSNPTSRHGTIQYTNKEYDDKLVFVTIRNPWYYYVSKYIFENKKNDASISGFKSYIAGSAGQFTKILIESVDKKFMDGNPSQDQIKDWFERDEIKFIGKKNLGDEMANLIEQHSDKFDLVENWKDNIPKLRENNRHMALIPREGNKWSGQPKYIKLGHNLKGNKYTHYYTDELANLIREKDRAIIETFGYEFTDSEYYDSIQNTVNSIEHKNQRDKWA